MKFQADADMVLRWLPSPRRRLLTQCGLFLAALMGVARVVSVPWSWRYLSDAHIQFLHYVIAVPPLTSLCFGWRRVYRSGLCQECGYDLTGNVSGVCPECGTAI